MPYLCTVKIKETTPNATKTSDINNSNISNISNIMKKLFFAAAIMMASVVSAFAQHEAGDITLQGRVGMIGSDFNNTSDTKARVGLVIGPEMEYFLTDRFSLGAGVLYTQQGAEQDKVDVTYEIDYVNVPLTANFYVWKGLALRAGLQPGFKVSSKIKYNDIEKDMDDAVKGFDLALPIGLSYEYRHFVIDARYTFGLNEIFDKDEIDLDSKNLTFQLSLAYKFKLK